MTDDLFDPQPYLERLDRLDVSHETVLAEIMRDLDRVLFSEAPAEDKLEQFKAMSTVAKLVLAHWNEAGTP